MSSAPGIIKQEEHILHLLFANVCLLHKLKHIEKIILIRGEMQHTVMGVFSSWRSSDQVLLFRPRFNIDLMLRFWDYESEAANSDEEWFRVLSLVCVAGPLLFFCAYATLNPQLRLLYTI